MEKTKQSLAGYNVRSVDEEKLQITHLVNTKAIDRYFTIVLPTGAKIENFMKNPVVLWLHNHDENEVKLPIGKCIDLQIRDGEIECTTQFNKNDPFAVKVFNSFKDGFLSAWSIGFTPDKYTLVTSENMEVINAQYNLKITEKDIADAGFYGLYVIYEWELLEYSAVPVPGNQEALTSKEFSKELMARGLVIEQKESECKTLPIEEKTLDNSENENSEEQSDEASVEISNSERAEGSQEENSEEASEEEIVEDPEDDTEETEEQPNESIEESSEDESEEDTANEERDQISELVEANSTLSEQVESLKELVATLAEEVSSMKKSLEVDNIDNLRQIQQSSSSEEYSGFFSRLVKKQ